MVDIALDDEELKRRMEGLKVNQATQAPQVAPQKSPMGDAGAQIMSTVMGQGIDTALTKGIAAGTGKGIVAGTGTGAMAGATAALPYVGIGLGLAKALGYLSNGGRVGPLYAASGQAVNPNTFRNTMTSAEARFAAGPMMQEQYKSAGGEVYTVKYGGPLSKGE